MAGVERELLDAAGIAAALDAMAVEIAARAAGEAVVLVGIRTRGAVVAARLIGRLRAAGVEAVSGVLDIALYRDDLPGRGVVPVLRATEIPVPLEGARVVLCDDVLFTGRTIRAALEAIHSLGRPARVELAVLVDRGNRELPIQAGIRGLVQPTTLCQHVRVCLQETDGSERVVLTEPETASP
jgi:pyrimidine operon attenuation protein / uracil phosphoribosyltransferase